MDRKLTGIAFFTAILYVVFIGCDSHEVVLTESDCLVYTDSNKVYKYNIHTQQKEKITELIGYLNEDVFKYSDSLVSVNFSSGTSFFIQNQVSRSTMRYTHEDFFKLYDMYNDTLLQYTADTTHYILVNVYTGETYHYRKDIDLDIMSQGTVHGYHIYTWLYAENGRIYQRHTYFLNDPNPWMDSNTRFYTESLPVNGNRVITSKGHLILQTIEGNDTLIENKADQWYYKFGDGAYQASLSPTGKQVVYRELAGDYDEDTFFQGKAIWSYSITTGAKEKIAPGFYENPRFSPGGQYILLNTYNGELTPPKRFYLYSTKDKFISQVLEGDQCIWF